VIGSQTSDQLLATKGDEYTDHIVQTIDQLQSRGTRTYGTGIFPSQRTHRYLPFDVEDETIFFTAATVYTLNAIRSDLSPGARHLVEEMTARSAEAAPRFLNNEGLPIYNFWQVQPEDRFFPNSRIFSRFRTFRLPEDIDTTAYLYLCGFHGRDDTSLFQQRLAFHANGSQRWIRRAFSQHYHFRAYSTWMGHSNMPVDFDVCAMSNALLALQTHGMPLSTTDEESVGFIAAVVEHDEHLLHPFQSAPWYGTTPVIIYHLARLIARSDIAAMRALAGKLAKDARRYCARTDLRPMERFMLSTAAMWLGETALVQSPTTIASADIDRYPFFVASILAVPENALVRILAPLDVFHLQCRCRAHSLALLLEHEIVRRQFNS
jgi:hypothetical protein